VKADPATASTSAGSAASSSSTTGAGSAEGAPGSSDGDKAKEDEVANAPKVAEKRPEKGITVDGARSVNKDLMQAAKAQEIKERAEGKKNTYWSELEAARS